MSENLCVEPNKDNLHNYVLDTTALNYLASNANFVNQCSLLVNSGHCYFITDVQDREIGGVPDRTGDYKNINAWKRPYNATVMLSIINQLHIEKISCVASLRLNFWILDGSMRILEDNGTLTEMFIDIYKRNSRYISDAQIAEAAMYHGCVLITNDKRLKNKVNKHFLDRAVSCDEYFHISGYRISNKA